MPLLSRHGVGSLVGMTKQILGSSDCLEMSHSRPTHLGIQRSAAPATKYMRWDIAVLEDFNMQALHKVRRLTQMATFLSKLSRARYVPEVRAG